MNEHLGYVIVALALIALASFVVAAVLRTRVHVRLLRDIRKGDFDDFENRIDGLLVRQTLSPYARELLRFQAFAAQGDHAQMVQQYNHLMALKLADPVRASLLMDGFNAFVKVGDRKHAKRILAAMTPDLVPAERKQLCERSYRKAFC